ncbi:MAG: hypothetical protein AAFU79_17465, partial [Myxococcota bacterium]
MTDVANDEHGEAAENPAPDDLSTGGPRSNTLSGPDDPDPYAATDDDQPAFWLPWLESRLPSERVAVGLVLLLGFLVFLPRLGSMGLWDPWETHYG